MFEGTPGDNANYDSSGNDIIHGCKGHDYVRFSGGNDTVLYARGDGSDLVDASQGIAGETDKLLLKADEQFPRTLLLTPPAMANYPA